MKSRESGIGNGEWVEHAVRFAAALPILHSRFPIPSLLGPEDLK